MTCSFFTESSPCGKVKENSTILPLLKCNDDMTSHLMSLGTGLKRGRVGEVIIEEWSLILNRSGHIITDSETYSAMTVCPKHRREFTYDWPGRKRNTCSYPTHSGQLKKLKTIRRVNLEMSREIFVQHHVCVPLGSGKS